MVNVILGLDPVPIYMFAAVIAWFSLVAVEFYERIYREKIEKNRELIWGYVQAEQKRIKDNISIPLKVNSQDLSAELDGLNKLAKRPDDFIEWRKRLTVLVVVFGGFAGYVAYRPLDIVFLISNVEWFVIAFFVVLLLNGYFVYAVFKVDQKITDLTKEEQRRKFPGGAQLG